MKNEKLKLWLLFIIVVILVVCLYSILSNINKNKYKKVKVINTILNYDYNLNENETPYYKKLFKHLKKILESNNIDEEEYASTISKMFVADFFSLKNASNKNDIGGVDFIYNKYKSTFIKKAKDTIYKYVENNIDGNRKQELPIVKEVKIKKLEKKEYKGKRETDSNAYYVDLEIMYEDDLKYQNKAKLILIHVNNKLEIVNME